MARRKNIDLDSQQNHVDLSKYRPATTPEAREKQLIALATDLAEQQLRDGTASAQVITHYLKLGSTTERIEQQMKQQKIELDAAKTEAIQSAKHVEELYTNAIAAMRSYAGQVTDDEGVDDDY